jgi:hypothetical protein
MVLIFSIVIENSGLAAVHNDSAPRAYKGLIARGYLGFLVRSFGWGFWYAVLVGFFGRRPAPFFSVDPGNLRPPAPAVIVLNP